VSARAESRRTLLVATAADIGQRLFALRRDEIVREGRVLAGGWPGTVREARALTVALLAPEFARHQIAPPTNDELGWALRAAYDEARRAWRSSAERCDGPEI
jgi:hypothetical protein